MNSSVYEDYKYSLQDTSRVYVGCRYTFGELLEAEEVMFKFRMVMQKYVVPETDLSDTLESHLYYLAPENFLVKLYRQMKARVRVNVIEERKHLIGGKRKEYVTKILTLEELVKLTVQEKEACGLVIQELSVSKLALMGL